MRFPILVVLQYLAGYTAAAAINDIHNLDLLPRAGCAQDNCYNAYTHSLSIASPFCSTYIRKTSIITLTPTATSSGSVLIPAMPITTTPVPPITTNSQLSSRCNLDTKTSLSLRLSSACTCISIVPTTVTSTVIAPTTTTTVGQPTSCPSYDGSSYTAANGEVFDAHCDTVFNGFKAIDYTCPIDFTPCIECCATLSQCIGISQTNVYGPFCQALSAYGSTQAVSDSNGRFNVAMLRRPTDCASYDGSNYQATRGAVFAVACNRAFSSETLLLAVSNVATYTGCAETCSTTAGCAAFDYSATTKACNLYSVYGAELASTTLSVGVEQSGNVVT